jgi:two-component system, sensor histidine kinase and response regulator
MIQVPTPSPVLPQSSLPQPALAQEEAAPQPSNTPLDQAFIAKLSEHLRSPLNTLLSLSQKLLMAETRPAERLQLQTLHDCGQELALTLNDVLELSEIGTQTAPLPVRSLATHSLLDKLVEQVAMTHLQKPVRIHYVIKPEVPPRLVVADFYIQKIIASLLDVALANTPHGDVHLLLSLAESPHQAPQLLFQVADTGYGFTPEQQQHIFDAFYSPAKNNRQAGVGRRSGLDLHLAYHLAERLGGKLHCTSVEGQGSVFELHIPLRKDEPSQRLLENTTEQTLGLLCLQANHTDAEQNLRFLGANLVYLAPGIPLAMQLAQYPVNGVIIDASGEHNGMAELDAVIAELASLQYPTSLVIRKGSDVDAFIPKLHSVIVAPVLMSEWIATTASLCSRHSIGASRCIAEAASAGRILVVEDNRLNQEIAQAMLEEAGFHVDIAENGEMAIAKLRQSPNAYQLILMDVQMPVMDGLQATRIIRQQLHNSVPIVAVTAGIAIADRKQCDDAGMDDFIPKPLDEHLMLQKVRFYIQQTQPKHTSPN